jgi:uncharacterized phage infection (PIP) family protein YhgE
VAIGISLSRRFRGWRSGIPKRILLGAGGVSQSAEASARRNLAITSPWSVLPHERTSQMALSDQLTKLAAKAKEAEDQAAAAKTKAKADLEQDVKQARASAQAQADQVHKNVETDKGKVSSWWADMQRSWREHLDTIRQHVDERKATHDLESAKRNADSAEEDAGFAIDYAYGAVEEAEYAVLDAILARMDADELAAGAKT